MRWLKRIFGSEKELNRAELAIHERVAILESTMGAFKRDLIDFDARYRRLRATQAAEERVHPSLPPRDASETVLAGSKAELRARFLPRPGGNGNGK